MRWYSRDKENLIENVRRHPNRRSAILRTNGISPDEYAEWERAYALGGKTGLLTTKIQHLRTSTVVTMIVASRVPLARIERSTGVSATTLSGWVHGKHIPSRTTAELVARFLQLERVRRVGR